MAFGECALSKKGRIVGVDSRKYSIDDTRVEAAGIDTKVLSLIH